MNETWIVYKAESMSSPNWEERKLLPSGGLTDILTESWDSSGVLPTIGDRIREYTTIEDVERRGITHGRAGDWVVTRVEQFSSFDTEHRIMVCYCSHQPVRSSWKKLERGAPVAEMIEASIQP